MIMSDDLVLSPDELKKVTGGYSQQAAQLAELHRQGFWRARRARRTGQVLLERAHYDAVCRGLAAQVTTMAQGAEFVPKLRSERQAKNR